MTYVSFHAGLAFRPQMVPAIEDVPGSRIRRPAGSKVAFRDMRWPSGACLVRAVMGPRSCAGKDERAHSGTQTAVFDLRRDKATKTDISTETSPIELRAMLIRSGPEVLGTPAAVPRLLRHFRS